MNQVGPDPTSLSSQAARKLASELLAAAPQDCPFDAQGLLERHPALRDHKSAVLDLAYEEFSRQLEAGGSIDAAEFAARFPTWQRSLMHLIDVDRYLQNEPRILDELSRVAWPAAGDTFLDFHLVEELGRGGFSRVFLAREIGLGERDVVVKICQRGTREANTLGKLQHSGIVPVHSMRQDAASNLTAICMPYLGRTTLLDVLDALLLSKNSPDVESILGVGVQLAEALDYTHGRGVCHCDIKPSNVLLAADGRALLFDFNLAFLTESDGANVGGTLPYMAPEQLRAIEAADVPPDAPDARTDLFALGVTLYELLSGELPFGPIPTHLPRRETAEYMLERQRTQIVPPLERRNRAVNRTLARVIESCLAFDPAGRPGSAAELAAALRRQQSRRFRTVRWARTHKRAAWAWAAVLAAVLLFSIHAWTTYQPYHQREIQSGRAAYRRHDYRQAAVHFTNSLEARQDNPQALFARGQAYLKLGRYRAALDEFDAAAQLASDEKLAACRAFCQAALNADLEQAERYYSGRVQSGRATAADYNNLAICLYRLGKRNRAAANIRQAAALDETLPVVQFNLAWLDFQEASDGPLRRPPKRELIERALQSGVESPYVSLTAGKIYALAASVEQDAGRAALDRRLSFQFCAQAVAAGLDPVELDGVSALFEPFTGDPVFARLRSGPRPAQIVVDAAHLAHPLADRDEPFTLTGQ